LSASAEHHQWEGQVEEEQTDKGRKRERLFESRVQRATCNPHECLHHNGKHRRLDAQEQRREPVKPYGIGIKH
jgi:hypothetical protein